MSRKAGLLVAFLVVGFVAGPVVAEVGHGSFLSANWPAPSSWTPPGVLADVSGPMPFVPMVPCRVADTRGNGFTGAYGPPSIGASTSRTFNISGSGCTGIPATAAAFSFNFTVTNTAGPGFVQAYPAGGAAGGTSAVNYSGAGQTVANFAITPAGTGANAGKITVTVGVSTTDLIIDINGYYAGAPSGGLGMNLTATTGNALTLNLTGNGTGLEINANTSGYSLWSSNASTTCSAICGGYFGINSTAADAYALGGYAYGSTARNIGVIGYSAGTGTSYTASGASIGVLGQATHTGTAYAHGVLGQTASSNSAAAGVFGEATAAAGSGGGFMNSASTGIWSWAAYWSGTTAMGFSTSGQIYGSNGLIIAGLPKSFVTPHPEDPSKEIMYVAAEGPTSDVFFRGTARLQNGVAVIAVPDHFRLVAREGSYMTTVTPVGSGVVLFIDSEGSEGIVVRGSGNVRFHYVVWGERDECKNHETIRPNTHFTPEEMERVNALKTFPEATRALLVKNGTLNTDGTYNQNTARRLNWAVPAPRPADEPAPLGLDEKMKR